MARRTTRTSPCGRAEAQSRLAQADAFVMVAELVLGDGNDAATPGVAAALAVLAGIAASDAACCAKLKVRSRGPNHDDSTKILATVAPHGAAMAKDLDRILKRKDDAHYGVALLNRSDATKLVGYARRLVDRARLVVES